MIWQFNHDLDWFPSINNKQPLKILKQKIVVNLKFMFAATLFNCWRVCGCNWITVSTCKRIATNQFYQNRFLSSFIASGSILPAVKHTHWAIRLAQEGIFFFWKRSAMKSIFWPICNMRAAFFFWFHQI